MLGVTCEVSVGNYLGVFIVRLRKIEMFACGNLKCRSQDPSSTPAVEQ